jgi:hypothetical protein
MEFLRVDPGARLAVAESKAGERPMNLPILPQLDPVRLAQHAEMKAATAYARKYTIPEKIPVSGQTFKLDLKNPPKPIQIDMSWVDKLQEESRQRIETFMAQRPYLGIAPELSQGYRFSLKA